MVKKEDLDKIIELKAHHDPNTPIYKLCDYLIKTAEVEVVEVETTDGNDD